MQYLFESYVIVVHVRFCVFFNDTATTKIYTLSLHDALPICSGSRCRACATSPPACARWASTSASTGCSRSPSRRSSRPSPRSEEHTSELQSRQYLVCRLLLEKNKTRQ